LVSNIFAYHAKGVLLMKNSFKMNLQLFAEDDDFFFPEEDVAETTQPEVEETQQIDVEAEETKPAETSEETTEETKPESPKVKLKYNHEEKEYSLDDVIPLAQKGMNYEKAIEKAKQDAKQEAIDEYIANQGYEWQGKPITTNDEYQRALYEQDLIEKGVPQEDINKLLDNHPTVKKAKEVTQAQREQEQSQQEFKDFLESFPDIKADQIPKEVWEYREAKGKSLTDAMLWHENSQLKSKLKILEQNAENTKKTPVSSTTAHGGEDTTSKDPFEMGFDSIL
jgi:ribosomal protein L7/L12